ncbi:MULTISPECIES: DUF4222 domain-containing protein [Dickeya]|uniref:DUF4222 domain-containing protein n=1 Tax=Dickeya aquatica TaxID=1401087 RepID=A0A375ABU3_9GAMM|nr:MULTISPECIES: DUF4222 domain-containing protein [Dickeya]SLM63520.1 hypothetical protein DAQ1742_02647 [Dickeya aquatica]
MEITKPLNRRYRDKNGVIVHVTGYEPATQRVIFTRPGYEHPCARPLWQVQKYFTRLDV